MIDFANLQCNKRQLSTLLLCKLAFYFSFKRIFNNNNKNKTQTKNTENKIRNTKLNFKIRTLKKLRGRCNNSEEGRLIGLQRLQLCIIYRTQNPNFVTIPYFGLSRVLFWALSFSAYRLFIF